MRQGSHGFLGAYEFIGVLQPGFSVYADGDLPDAPSSSDYDKFYEKAQDSSGLSDGYSDCVHTSPFEKAKTLAEWLHLIWDILQREVEPIGTVGPVMSLKEAYGQKGQCCMAANRRACALGICFISQCTSWTSSGPMAITGMSLDTQGVTSNTDC
jgi:hypothetical protein